MKYKIGALLMLLSASAFGSEIEKSVELGNSLTAMVKSKSDVKLKSLTNYKEIRSYLKENGCPRFKYKQYIIRDGDVSKLYLVASKGKSVIIGRHFTGSLIENTADISSFSSSTNGCVDLGAPKKDAAAMFVTHLKPEPNEFHVLESNLANIALYVSTKEVLYSVSGGEIKVIEK